MTIRFDWDPVLETGIAEVDAQHKELFRRANLLFAACVVGKGVEETRSALEFLGNHIQAHFKAEQELLEATGFSAARAHARRHKSLALDFERVRSQLETAGPGEQLLILTNRLLLNELRHIKNEDQAFAPFVRAAMATQRKV